MSLFYRAFGDLFKYQGLLIGIYSVTNTSEEAMLNKIGVVAGLFSYLLGNYLIRSESQEGREKFKKQLEDIVEEAQP